VLDNPSAVEQDGTMSKRPVGKRKSSKVKDVYLRYLGKIWPTILRAYADFKEMKPIIEYRLREKAVLAYPALPYIDDLTKRTREQTRQNLPGSDGEWKVHGLHLGQSRASSPVVCIRYRGTWPGARLSTQSNELTSRL
jgi:hypothetical protein